MKGVFFVGFVAIPNVDSYGEKRTTLHNFEFKFETPHDFLIS